MATTLPKIEGDPDEWKSNLQSAPPTRDDSEPADPTLKKTSSHHQSIRRGLGLHPTAPIDEEHDLAPHQDYLWSRIRLVFREPFSEFLGTFILVLFGDGSVAQVVMSTGETSAPGKSGAPDRPA